MSVIDEQNVIAGFDLRKAPGFESVISAYFYPTYQGSIMGSIDVYCQSGCQDAMQGYVERRGWTCTLISPDMGSLPALVEFERKFTEKEYDKVEKKLNKMRKGQGMEIIDKHDEKRHPRYVKEKTFLVGGNRYFYVAKDGSTYQLINWRTGKVIAKQFNGKRGLDLLTMEQENDNLAGLEVADDFTTIIK